MANMAYCKFCKTASDFDDCLEFMENINDLESELSPEELEGAHRLYRIAKRYVELFPAVAYDDEG